MSTDAAEATPTPEPRPRRRWRWVVDVAIGLAIYLVISTWQTRDLIDDGTSATGFSLESLSGERVRLEDFRGKRVLLHFWATWCGVCQREYGALEAVQAGLDEDEVLLTIVADGDDPSAVRELVAREGITYPVLLGDDDVVRAYRVHAFPTNYFVDAQGRVADHTVGMSTRWSLAARLSLAD